MALKDWIAARFDPSTGSIKGCRENTLVWHHEDRHKQQFENELLDKISHGLYVIFEGGSLGFFSIVMIFGQLTQYSQIDLIFFGMQLVGLAATPFLLLQFAFELDAWIYTLRKLISGDYKELA